MSDAAWEDLFTARGGLTSWQVQVMSIVCSKERTIRDIAFLLGDKPASTAARIVNILTKKRLVYYDLVGVDGSYIVRPTPEGEQWVKEHNVPV